MHLCFLPRKKIKIKIKDKKIFSFIFVQVCLMCNVLCIQYTIYIIKVILGQLNTMCMIVCAHTHTCVHMWCMTDLHMVLPLNVNTNTQKSTKFETIHSASNTIQTITILGSAIKSNLEAQTQKWWANTLSLIFKLFLCKKKKKFFFLLLWESFNPVPANYFRKKHFI